MRIWVLVRKIGNKFSRLYMERFEITGKAMVEFVWIGDDLGEDDIAFLDGCMKGEIDVVGAMNKFIWSGTNFQLAVWKKIAEIPRGEVWSYKDLAEEVGRPRSYRAVANACSRSPFGFVIPCHRVVASGGKFGGYFYDLKVKEVLLVWEGM